MNKACCVYRTALTKLAWPHYKSDNMYWGQSSLLMMGELNGCGYCIRGRGTFQTLRVSVPRAPSQVFGFLL